MQTGYLRIEAVSARTGMPILAALVSANGGELGSYSLITDISGRTELAGFAAPDSDLSLDSGYEGQVYSTCDVSLTANGYKLTQVTGVQIFAGQTAILKVEMEPLALRQSSADTVVLTIPPMNINDPDYSQGPAIETFPRILDSVVVPEYVTVHLGRPDVSAQNVTVLFPDYIKNVCCSEIYPTWPAAAVRANVFCQISLVLNRVFTEWYPSRGYAFDITNSTSYDQYFVYGRNIYESVSKIVDEIFDIYIRKNDFVEPFYAEYCNGTTATCPGLKQWGTVTLANQGYTPLAILQYYYGTGVSLAAAAQIAGTASSYGGTSLSLGSTGSAVTTIQAQLTRIRQNYPLIPDPGSADGIFGSKTRSAVVQFQSIFNLTADGVVGKATWYKISYIFTAVKKLAELTSEGITTPAVPGDVPAVVLKAGFTGEAVVLAQYLLTLAADFYEELNPIAVDGIFGNATYTLTVEYQQFKGLAADGVIGAATWSSLYDTFYGIMNSVTEGSAAYPGVVLTVGSSGESVALMQRYLNVIGQYFTSIPLLTIDGIFGPATKEATQVFQTYFGLTVDGKIGPQTWQQIVNVYDSLVKFY